MSRIFSTLPLTLLIATSVTTFASPSFHLQPSHNLAGSINLSGENQGTVEAFAMPPSKHKKHKKKMNKQMKKRKHH